MSKIKNYVKATAYKVAVLLDLVDDNQRMKDGKTVTLLKDGTPANEANAPINIVLHRNDDDTAIFVDGFLNGTAISTAHLYTNMNILQCATEIIGHQVSPWGNYFTLTFNDILNAPATGVTEWDTFFSTSTKANTGFTNYEILNNSGLLYGPSALTLKQNLFKSNTAITSIVDNNIIASIESTGKDSGVFYQCMNLTYVSLAKVSTVGNYAFYSCTSLANISLPSATTIGASAFISCVSLSSISLQNVITISNLAFSTCSSLSSVMFSNVITMGDNVFQNCTSLSNVNLPKVETIGNYMFNMDYKTSALTYLNLSSCTSMGTGVFNNISGCTIDLYIPLAMTGETSITELLANNNVTINP